MNSHPFHAGEIAVQERAGVRERVAEMGPRMIRDAMPEQHRELFGKLPMMLVGSLDVQGRPWASVMAGRPGFIHAPDAQHLRFDTLPAAEDPLAHQLSVGVPLGLLGIEPHTRRRNRMNGTVQALDDHGFTVAVDQSFGNCPQYIQARQPSWADAPPSPAHSLGASMSPPAIELIRRSDTLFIATAAAQARGHDGANGVDVSHRGGRPGFVRVDVDPTTSQGTLTLPDFRGNNMFNTLGNIAANPRAGLLFFDPATGDVLQLTARAQIVWDGPELASFEGAQRLLHLHIDEALWRPGALSLRWSEAQWAPQLAATGSWSQVGA